MIDESLGALEVWLAIYMGFPGGSLVKNSPAKEKTQETGLTPGSERSPGGGSGNPLQHSCLDNFMNREAWWVTVHGVTESQTESQT